MIKMYSIGCAIEYGNLIWFINISQLLMRREFTATYDQAIALIKQLKNSNDHLNRAVGLDTHQAIAARLRREQPLIQITTAKIDALIQKLEQSYLDPDTARKIGTAKQQFRIQRDRRSQLLLSANYEEGPSPKKESNELIAVSHQQQPEGRSNQSNWSRYTQKESETTSSSVVRGEEEMEVEFEMERKLMHERNNEINIVANSIMNVHNIMNETGALVHEQGEQLDIIGEELFTTYRNVSAAREEVTEANEIQQRARRKYVYFSVLIILLVAAAALILFV